MNRIAGKKFIFAVGGCLIAMLIAGCEEQNLSTAKKTKLIAYENRQLKEQLAQQEKKFEEQSRLLGECQQKKEVLEKKSGEELTQQKKKIEEQNRLLTEYQQKKLILEKGFEEQLAQQKRSFEERIAQQETKIKEQLAQRENKIEEQDGLLKECRQRREILENRFEEAVATAVSEDVGIFKQSDEQMEQENNKLEAQVEELKAQVSKLEQQLKDINSPAEPRSLTP